MSTAPAWIPRLSSMPENLLLVGEVTLQKADPIEVGTGANVDRVGVRWAMLDVGWYARGIGTEEQETTAGRRINMMKLAISIVAAFGLLATLGVSTAAAEGTLDLGDLVALSRASSAFQRPQSMDDLRALRNRLGSVMGQLDGTTREAYLGDRKVVIAGSFLTAWRHYTERTVAMLDAVIAHHERRGDVDNFMDSSTYTRLQSAIDDAWYVVIEQLVGVMRSNDLCENFVANYDAWKRGEPVNRDPSCPELGVTLGGGSSRSSSIAMDHDDVESSLEDFDDEFDSEW